MNTVPQKRDDREKLLAEYRASGLGQRQFAETHGIRYSTLKYWLAIHGKNQQPIRMARVVLGSEPTGTTSHPQSSTQSVIVEMGRARLLVQPGFDRNLFSDVLDLLETRCHKGVL